MRPWITGGAGFLGPHLSRSFRPRVTRSSRWNLITGSTDNIAHLAGHERFSYIKHDVTNYMSSRPLDAILHFASPACRSTI
jgi:dTDP-glucose 4,6-dehydratase